MTVRERFSLRCAVWLLSSIFIPNPFRWRHNRDSNGAGSWNYACLRSRGTAWHCSLRASGRQSVEGHCDDVVSPNRASAPENICRHDAAPGAARISCGFPAAGNLLVVGYRTFLNC